MVMVFIVQTEKQRMTGLTPVPGGCPEVLYQVNAYNQCGLTEMVSALAAPMPWPGPASPSQALQKGAMDWMASAGQTELLFPRQSQTTCEEQHGLEVQW